MDWLSANHILIYCGRKKLIFPRLEGMHVILAQQFEREIQEGAKKIMLLACSIVTDKVQKEMFVVQEFMDVFPDEIPGLPPKRERVCNRLDSKSRPGVNFSIPNDTSRVS